jgi:hypothetical protein
MACSNFAGFVGFTLWFSYYISEGTHPFPSWADPFFLSSCLLLFTGLLFLSPKLEKTEERVKFSLDVTTVMLAGSMAYGYFIFDPTTYSETQSILTTAVVFAYPMTDLGLLLGMMTLLLKRAQDKSRPSMVLLLAAGCCLLTGDLVYYSTVERGFLVDIAWILYPFLQVVNSQYQYVRLSNALPAPALLRAKSNRGQTDHKHRGSCAAPVRAA